MKHDESENIEKYRRLCIFYVKMDLGLFAAVATVITILKVDMIGILKYITQYKILLIYVTCSAAFGLILDLMLFQLSVQSKEEFILSQTRKKINIYSFRQVLSEIISAVIPLPVGRVLTRVYAFSHVLLLIGIVAFFLGYIEAYLNSENKLKNQTDSLIGLQQNIEQYKEDFGTFPKKLGDLIDAQYPVIDYVKRLGTLDYKTDKKLGYIINYKAMDGNKEGKAVYFSVNHQLYLQNKVHLKNKNQECEGIKIEYFTQ